MFGGFVKSYHESKMQERAIENFEGYRIRSDGTVWLPNQKRWTYGMTKMCGKAYYAYVVLLKNDKRFYKNIHRLVGEHFVVNPRLFAFDEVDHIINNTLDNRACNLRWLNHQLNMRNQAGKPYFRKRWKKWQVNVNGRTHGYFKDKAEAQRVRDEVAAREFQEMYDFMTTDFF